MAYQEKMDMKRIRGWNQQKAEELRAQRLFEEAELCEQGKLKESYGRRDRAALGKPLLIERCTKDFGWAVAKQRRELSEREEVSEREMWWDLGTGRFEVLVLGDAFLGDAGCWGDFEDGEEEECVGLKAKEATLPMNLLAGQRKMEGMGERRTGERRTLERKLKKKLREINLLQKFLSMEKDVEPAATRKQKARVKGKKGLSIAARGKKTGERTAMRSALAEFEWHDVRSETIEEVAEEEEICDGDEDEFDREGDSGKGGVFDTYE
jgi:hypothetical protein